MNPHHGRARALVQPEPYRAQAQAAGWRLRRALSRLRAAGAVPVRREPHLHAGRRTQGKAVRCARLPSRRARRGGAAGRAWVRQRGRRRPDRRETGELPRRRAAAAQHRGRRNEAPPRAGLSRRAVQLHEAPRRCGADRRRHEARGADGRHRLASAAAHGKLSHRRHDAGAQALAGAGGDRSHGAARRLPRPGSAGVQAPARAPRRQALLGQGEWRRAGFAPGRAVRRCRSLCTQAGAGIRRSHALGYRLAAPQPGRDSRRRPSGRSAGRDRALRSPAPSAPRRQPAALLRFHQVKRLQGRVAIITGAGSVGPGWGNGRATAVRFAEEGAKGFAVDRDAASLRETVQKAAVKTHICDVTDGVSVKAMVQSCLDEWGRIDILVNNVGGSVPGGPVEMSEELWDAQVDHNLKSVFLACKHVLPVMERQAGGVIINLASTSGLRWTGSAQVAYAATKAAVIQLSRVVAVQYASKGIRVNTVVPGQLHTPMVEARLARERAGGNVEALLASRLKRIPLGFAGDGRDTANAALFLASDEARFITGTEIVVDGGMTVRCD